jgi:hypothetical protein
VSRPGAEPAPGFFFAPAQFNGGCINQLTLATTVPDHPLHLLFRLS